MRHFWLILERMLAAAAQHSTLARSSSIAVCATYILRSGVLVCTFLLLLEIRCTSMLNLTWTTPRTDVSMHVV
jgi:hypothetical protein